MRPSKTLSLQGIALADLCLLTDDYDDDSDDASMVMTLVMIMMMIMMIRR